MVAKTPTIGVLGGGQLGRMMQESASRLGLELIFLDADPKSPAKQICASDKHVTGGLTDEKAIRDLAARSDILTIEIEHVNAEALKKIQAETGIRICPDPADISLIKDKFQQKEKLKTLLGEGAVAEQYAVESTSQALQDLGDRIGFPYILKSRTDAYDGRGNFVVKSKEAIPEALQVLKDRPLYGEKMVKFVRELAVMVLRTLDGEVHSYPVVETVHEDNICKTVFAPADIPIPMARAAKQLAEQAIKQTFVGAGIFGVELFELEDGSIMLNEIAPRPHNSGHYTIEACTVSQFQAHLLAITGSSLPRNITAQNQPSIMYNLLGAQDPDYITKMSLHARTIEGASVHLYGKAESRPQRKMGHITITRSTMAECHHSYRALLNLPPSSSSSSMTADPSPSPSLADTTPVKILICMGSASDGPRMKPCEDVLEQLGVAFHKEIISAHRQPQKLRDFAMSAKSRGYRVVIAAAGGAAHLPGMFAAFTSLPVIGVPINATSLNGHDSSLSIQQMPAGVPVATMAIDGAKNAGLYAVRTLGVVDETRLRQIEQLMEDNRKIVDTANESFRRVYAGRDPFE